MGPGDGHDTTMPTMKRCSPEKLLSFPTSKMVWDHVRFSFFDQEDHFSRLQRFATGPAIHG